MTDLLPDAWSRRAERVRRWLGRHGWDLLFWSLLVAAAWAVCRPVWVGPILPTTDFGGHLAIADVWARYDEIEIYREAYELQGGLIPNTISARFVGWVHPMVSTVTGLRLFTTLALVATILGVLAVLRTFGRWRWLVFAAFPFLWNGSFYGGMVNYFASFPLFLFAIALARKTGASGNWRWGLGLTAVCTFSFFVHGLGCPFTVASAALVLALSLQRWRDVGWFTAFVPATALWMYWRKTTEAAEIPDRGLWAMLEKDSYWLTKRKMVSQLVKHANDFTTQQIDTVVFLLVVAILVVWWGVGRAAGDGVQGEERSWYGRCYAALRAHALLLLVVVLGAGIFVLPSYIHLTNIASRLVPLFLWTAICVPRAPSSSLLVKSAAVGAVVVSLGFGQFVDRQMQRFERVELEPMMAVVREIPEGQRVEFLNHRKSPLSGLRGHPLWHAGAGLVHARRSGYGGFPFPETGFNPIRFSESYGYPTLNKVKFSQLGRLQWWDYVVVRGNHRRPPERLAEQVAESGARTVEGAAASRSTRYRLFRIRDLRIDASHRAIVGGDGGRRFRWPCPEGQAVRGLELRGSGRVDGVRARCGRAKAVRSGPEDDGGDPEGADDSGDSVEGPRLEARGEAGPSIGSGRPVTSATCPAGEFLVGLAGKSGLYVDRVDLLCAPARRSESDGVRWDEEEADEIEGAGGQGGSAYRITCPTDSVVRGITGREGARLDALGITCQEASKVVP